LGVFYTVTIEAVETPSSHPLNPHPSHIPIMTIYGTNNHLIGAKQEANIDTVRDAPVTGGTYETVGALRAKPADDIFKAFIPDYLYKPPFGYPHRTNLPFLRKLATTPNVFSIVKTLSDESSSLKWEVVMKEGADFSSKEEEKLKDINKWFKNPNGNEESWEHIQRCLIRDILEVDAGVGVKVFNRNGEFKQLFSRDGMTFLKNPDIYGYIGNRAELVFPAPMPPDVQAAYDAARESFYEPIVQQYYRQNYANKAAYFQYGWTAGSMPKPFGRREIMYIMQNPRSDSVYGRSPVQMAADTVQTLLYGSLYNLDFYINGNMPEGMISLPGAQIDEIKAFRKQFESQFQFKDALDNKRRLGYKYPISNIENAKFVPFAFTSKDMQILEQQEWFSKILWMCFGVTPDEMGFTESSNRAIASEQAKVFKRKAIRPLTNVLAYHINSQLLPEFAMDWFDDWDTAQKECPYEFKYIDYDVEDDIKKHTLWKMQLDMGVKTKDMVAEELGVNLDELRQERLEALERQQEAFANQNEETAEQVEETVVDEQTQERPMPEEVGAKAQDEVTQSEVLKEIDTYISDIGKAIENEIQEGR